MYTKIVKSFLLTLVVSFVSQFLLQSCLSDNDDFYLAIATLRTTDNNELYFVLDTGKKMYANLTKTGKQEEGQRYYVHFEILEEEKSGYDYNIKIHNLEEIMTKSPFIMTEATIDSIGDDKINITDAWFGDGYLNIQYQFLGTSNTSKQHIVSLVYNQIKDADTNTEEGYINLEFRLNALNNKPVEVINGIVSFKGPFSEESMKGLNVRYNSIYDNIKYLKIDFSNINPTNFLVGSKTYKRQGFLQ